MSHPTLIRALAGPALAVGAWTAASRHRSDDSRAEVGGPAAPGAQDALAQVPYKPA